MGAKRQMKGTNKKLKLWRNVIWCFSFSKKEMGIVLLASCLTLLSAYMSTLEPIYSGAILDSLIDSDFRVFLNFLLILFGLEFANLLVKLLCNRINYKIQKNTTILGESLFFEKVFIRENAEMITGREAEILNIIQNDIPFILSVWTSIIPGFFVSTITLFIISFTLICINVWAFCLTSFLSIIPFFVYYFAGRKEDCFNRESKVLGDTFVSSVKNNMNQCYDITERSEVFFLSSFTEIVLAIFKVYRKKLDLSQLASLLLFGINAVSVFLLYLFLGYSVYIGVNSVGEFLTAVFLSQQLRANVKKYGITCQKLIANTVSIERVRKYMDMNEKRWVEYHPAKNISITFQDVYFAYQRNRMVLKGLSFSFDGPGLFILKGNNGTGKTTILKIILSMLDNAAVAKGRIIVGGIKSPSEIAYLPSNPNLYESGTIRDNLLFGEKGLDGNLLDMFEKVGLTEWLGKQGNGLETFCDREKIGMSKGQLLRFGLLANLVREKKIYLIDEIEEGIDRDSRNEILTLLKELSLNKIVMLVSHSHFFDKEGVIINL